MSGYGWMPYDYVDPERGDGFLVLAENGVVDTQMFFE